MGHAGGKPEQDMCAELCSWSLFRGQPPVFKDTLQTKTRRDREALLRKEVSHFWCPAQKAILSWRLLTVPWGPQFLSPEFWTIITRVRH